MRIGIVIPTYNRLDFLRRSLSSALLQSHEEIDVLVIDNGSTDGTARFMADVRDPRLRYVVNETNLGPVGSIARGISLLADRVEWCTVLCDDDVLDRDLVGRLAAAARELGATSVVRGHLVFLDAAGNAIREAAPAPREERAMDYLLQRARFARETYLTGVMFRIAAYERIGGYPRFTTGMASDDALIFALSLADRLVFERSAVASVTIHPDAVSQEATGAERHFRALDEFAAYVRRVAADIGRYDAEALSRVEAIAASYVRSLNSALWLRSAGALAGRREEWCRRELEGLCDAARTGRHPFPPRVRLDAFCLRAAGLYPESSRLYRSAWKGLEKLLFRI